MSFKLILKASLLICFCVSLCFFNAAQSSTKQTQQNVFIDKGTCPYEGCFYGFWRATEDFPLYEKVGSSKIIATAKKGTNIKSLTGEVHTLPDIIQFNSDFKPIEDYPYQPNTKIEVLTYEGEGVFKTKYLGKIIYDDFIYCAVSGDGCGKDFAKTTEFLQRGERTWWIKIQLKNNKIGWAKETQGQSLPISHADQLSGEPLLKGFNDRSK